MRTRDNALTNDLPGQGVIAIFKRAFRTGISNIMTIESQLTIYGGETLQGEKKARTRTLRVRPNQHAQGKIQQPVGLEWNEPMKE